MGRRIKGAGFVSACAVRRVYRHGGGMTRRPRWSAAQAAYVRRFYGVKTAREIGETIGKTEKDVRSWARRNGLRSDLYRNHEGRGEAHWIEFLGLYIAGLSRAELAYRYGVADGTVNSWFNRLWGRIGE